MRARRLAQFLMDVVFKGLDDMPVILREAHEDGGDYEIGALDVRDGKVNIWFNKDYPINNK